MSDQQGEGTSGKEEQKSDAKTDADGGAVGGDTKDGEDSAEATAGSLAGEDWFREYFSIALGLTVPESVLDEVSFEGIARYIQSETCQKIVTLAGAGISTSAGIPDFRSPGTGIYDRLKEFDIEDPKRVFELDYFKEHPEIVYNLRKELMLGTYKPTACHYFVRLLHEKKKLLRHFTQNIDGLEMEAGMDPDVVVQAHGTCQTYHCMECKHPYTKQHMTEVLNDESLKVPKCEQKKCDGVIRPDIVFFGENLHKSFSEKTKVISECDMMIILGTSLVVQPFASLTNMTKGNVPRLYINLENTGRANMHPIAALMFGGGFDFDKEENIKDIFWQGTCDDGCYALADLIGWGDELRELVKTEHANIDKKLANSTKHAQKKSPTMTPTTSASKVGIKSQGGTSTEVSPKKATVGGSAKTSAKTSINSTKPKTSTKQNSSTKPETARTGSSSVNAKNATSTKSSSCNILK